LDAQLCLAPLSLNALLSKLSPMLRLGTSASDVESVHEDSRSGRLEKSDGERLDRPRPSPRTPDELLLEILEYIVPGPSFSEAECRRMDAALSQTCRLFASVTIPRLFRHLNYYHTQSGATTLPPWLQLVQIGEAENRVAALYVASCVRSVNLKLRLESEGSARRLASTLDSLLLLPRLTRMDLYDMTVTSQLVDIIAHMNTLRSLLVKQCHFLEADQDRLCSHATELMITTGGWNDIANSPPTRVGLKKLVCARILRKLRVCDRSNLANQILRERGPFPVLEEAAVEFNAHTVNSLELSEALSVLLEQTPSLSIIRVLSSRQVPSRLPTIHANLPRLSVLQIPSWMLSLVGALHTVSTLHLYSPDLDIALELRACATARDLFVNLKRLRIDAKFLDRAGSILSLSRRVVTLEVEFDFGDWVTATMDDVSVCQ
jgi:hypothetical protein